MLSECYIAISLKYIASYFGNKYVYMQGKYDYGAVYQVVGTAGCLTNSFFLIFLASQALIWKGGMGFNPPPCDIVECNFTLPLLLPPRIKGQS